MLEAVYQAYSSRVEGYLRTLVSSSADNGLGAPATVADLVQEVFARAFSAKALAAYDPTRPYAQYLRAITRNCFVDSVRARCREVLSPEVGAEGDDDGVDTGPLDDDLQDPKVRDVLQAYLDALPAELRRVYEQRYVFGRSQATACAALGVSRRQLRTHEERLKRGLRKALQSEGVSLREIG